MSSRSCISCSAKIPDARLAASPLANRCINCQTSFEKDHDVKIKFDDISSAIHDTNYKSNPRQIKPRIAAASTVACPHCGNNVGHLAKHIRKKHAEQATIKISNIRRQSSKSETASTPISSATPEFSKHFCELCRILFSNNSQLELHRNEKHSYKITLKYTPSQKFSFKQKTAVNAKTVVNKKNIIRPQEKHLENQSFICSICKRKLKSKNGLTMHIVAIHSFNSKSTGISKNKKRNKAKVSPSSRNSGKAQTYHQIPHEIKLQRESTLDGSRDYYSNYRENGRLGSHASHDAYGDEDFA